MEAVVGAGLLDVGGGGLTQFDATVLGVPVGDAGQRSVVGLVEGGLLAGELVTRMRWAAAATPASWASPRSVEASPLRR